MTRDSRPRVDDRIWAIGAAIAGFMMLGIYLTALRLESDDSVGEILPWAALMALAPSVALASLFVANRNTARNLLITSALLFGGLGIVSLFTIGVGFLAVSGIAATAASRLVTPPDIDS